MSTNDEMYCEEPQELAIVLTADDYEDKLKQLLSENNLTEEDSEALVSSKVETFVAIFDVNFKSRKAVKLHQILTEISINFNTNLLSFGNKLSQLYGKAIRDLPFGQLMEIWSLFLTKFKVKNKFLVKLLSIFLQHIRCLDDCLPKHLTSQLVYLQNETKHAVKSTSKYLSSSDEELVEILLELYFSIKSLDILQMAYNHDYSSGYLCKNDDEVIEKIVSNEWYDLSVIYDFINDFDWRKLCDKFSELSLKSRQTLIKCLFQKFHFCRVIEMNSVLSEEQRLAINSTVERLLSSLVSTDFAANHLNSFTLQQMVSIIRNSPNHKNLCILTDSIASDISKTEEDNFDVERLLIDGDVWESIPFQMAFIGSFWKQISLKLVNKKRKIDEEIDGRIETLLQSLATNHSFWFKYATHSPNSPKAKKLWSNISELSAQTQQLMESIDRQTIKKSRILLKYIQLFYNAVPLEYLLPANQMRCLLSLSVLLFGLDFTDDTNNELLDLILDSILRIFDGFRSVWFFNYIHPSVYLINFLKIVGNYENTEKLRILMTKFVENIFRNTNQIEDLKNKLLENEDKISFELLLMIETIILKRSLHVLNMQSVPKNLIEVKQFCGSLSHQLSNTIHNRIKSYLSSQTDIESFNSLLVIDSFSVIFEFQVSKASEETVSLKTKWRKLLAKLIDISTNQLVGKTSNQSCVKFLVLLCGQRKKLANILPENLMIDLWLILCRIDKQFDVLQLEYTLKDFDLNDYLNDKDNLNYKDLNAKIESTEKKNRNHFFYTLSDQNILLDSIKPLIIAIIQCSTAEEFEVFLKLMTNQLETLDYSLTSYTLKLWIAIFESNFQTNEEKNTLFLSFVNDLMAFCANQCQKSNQNQNRTSAQFQTDIKVPVLVIMRSVLHITKSVISSPQLFLSYHACIDTRINVYVEEPEVFVVLFEAMYGVLNEILLQHKYIAISSMASFNAIVKNLIQSLMTVSEEHKFIEYKPTLRHRLEICSKNSDRLLTLMASLGSDYSSHAPHLVSAYVTQTKRIAVHSTVKKNIISGMNRLFRVLSESNQIDMIYSRMDESSRKIFKMLFDNYEKYYKFKGQV